MILNVDGVAFAYNGRDVLRDIGFTVRRGDLLVILGPNGVGKTTLLRCMNAILKPHRGVVMMEDRDILGLSPMQIARRIGYVSQRQAAARLTAFDAVLMGRRRCDQLRLAAQERFMATGLAEMFAVQPVETDPPRPPRVLESLPCAECGEMAMESRTRRFDGRTLCIACFDRVEQKM